MYLKTAICKHGRLSLYGCNVKQIWKLCTQSNNSKHISVNYKSHRHRGLWQCVFSAQPLWGFRSMSVSNMSRLCQDSEYMVAVRNYITEDRSLLNFHKGDIIRLQHMDGLEAGETQRKKKSHAHWTCCLLLWAMHCMSLCLCASCHVCHAVCVCVHVCVQANITAA